MEQITEELKFLLTVNDAIEVGSSVLDDYLKRGYKIIGVQQYKDCDNLISVSFIVGRHKED